MALGDQTIVNAQTRAQYEAQNSKLRGELFDTVCNFWSGNSNFLAQLQGPKGSGKAFVIKSDLEKFPGDTINISVGDELGQAGRRGDDRLVNFEETPAESSFAVKVDVLRVGLGYNQLSRFAAANKVSTAAAYPMMTGKRVGQIEQEDMLLKIRQRSNTQNTVMPGGKTSIDTLRYSDTLDSDTLNVGYNILTSNGADPTTIGTMTGGMELNKYVALGANFAFTSLWQDPRFTSALLHAAVDGPTNPFWTNDLPDYNGLVLKRLNIRSHSNPGPIGSTLIPEALLGDPITSATTTFDVYGSGRTQSSLGSAAVIYKPFEQFYGCDKLFGKSISTGADANTYYFLAIDPADQKWCMYSYVGTDIGSNGYKITITGRLHSSTTGAAALTLGNVTYDSSVNKLAFPTGSRIVQCNAYGVPVTDVYLLGAEAGAKAYGAWRNKQVSNSDDYDELQGVGTKSVYGCEMKIDTLGNYHRGFVRIPCAYVHPLGSRLAQL